MVLTNEADIFSGHVLDATDQRAQEKLKLNEILVSGQKGSWRRGSSQKCSSFFFSPEICQKSINGICQKKLATKFTWRAGAWQPPPENARADSGSRSPP